MSWHMALALFFWGLAAFCMICALASSYLTSKHKYLPRPERHCARNSTEAVP